MKPIILTPLQSGNPCLSEVVSLYEKAFPLEERRPTDEWLEKNSSSDLLTINLLESDGQTKRRTQVETMERSGREKDERIGSFRRSDYQIV